MPGSECEVEALCQEQFDEAASGDAINGYNYAQGPGEYYFGKSIPKRLRVLGRIPRLSNTPVNVLDVGAGKGNFLYAAKQKYRGRIRAVGFTAANHVLELQDGIDWVYGDIQRQHTWRPPEALRRRSIDVAVSSLLFGHLIHPAAALRNVLELLRPGGNLYVDAVQFLLDAQKSHETAGVITEDLRRSQGRYGLKVSYDDATHTGRHCLIASDVHLQVSDLPILGRLRPIVQETTPPQIVYTV